MILIASVPVTNREAFASFVDNILSKELDWNLVAFERSSPDPSFDQTSLYHLVEYTSSLADLPLIRGSVPSSVLASLLLDTPIEFVDLWVFALSSLNSLEDVSTVTAIMCTLGCRLGLLPFDPLQDHLKVEV